MVFVGLWERIVMPLASTSWLTDTTGRSPACPACGPNICENGCSPIYGWPPVPGAAAGVGPLGSTCGTSGCDGTGAVPSGGMPSMPWSVRATSSGSA